MIPMLPVPHRTSVAFAMALAAGLAVSSPALRAEDTIEIHIDKIARTIPIALTGYTGEAAAVSVSNVAGIEDILVIIGRNKNAISNHFDSVPELEVKLLEKGDHGRPEQATQIGGQERQPGEQRDLGQVEMPRLDEVERHQ